MQYSLRSTRKYSSLPTIAAEALKLTGKDLFKLNLVDSIIPEPLGGAHRKIHDTVYTVEQYITRTLAQLKRINLDKLVNDRYEKLRNIGTSCDKAQEIAPQHTAKASPEIPERLSIKAQLNKAVSEKT